ncbi:hypothetical protein SPBR_05182 [Sporothrix brasiliensis 5110]|uniref:Uncharacterized protein n=1 Tax=Sporothrix brasiliensis 5110 TaxID=1398154 RepID=A0A0C2F8C1_9PEZI|nr:uncharacterized protein SPBR_05182 [Sporothrix brasiliensis 5110]KIH87288.1 hypothetical protein SPBR_05182 [Sporothrix brasiliensis 5110]
MADAAIQPSQPVANPPVVKRARRHRPAWHRPPEQYQSQSVMAALFKALETNDLHTFDKVISAFLALGPATGRDARTIHSLSSIMYDVLRVDNVAFAERLLQRGVPIRHDVFGAALDESALRCLALFLRSGYDVNEPEGATTPPVWAFFSDDEELTYWLLDHGANMNVDAPYWNMTAMSNVVQWGTLELVCDLLNDPRHLVDMNKGDLLHYALNRETDDIVPVLALLLDHGAPINEGLFARHRSCAERMHFMPQGPPLHTAAEKGNLKAVQFLLSRHADVSIRDTKGETALCVAQTNGHTEIAEVLQEAMAKYKAQHL